MEKEKVYCEKCKHAGREPRPYRGLRCWHPENIRSSPARKIDGFKETVYELNRNYDCAWFEKAGFLRRLLL